MKNTKETELSIDEMYELSKALIKVNTEQAHETAAKVGFDIGRRKDKKSEARHPPSNTELTTIRNKDVHEMYNALIVAKNLDLANRVFEVYCVVYW